MTATETEAGSITFEEIVTAMGDDLSPMCEGRFVPACLACPLDLRGCERKAEWAARNDCGCVYLMCSTCPRSIATHFKAHGPLLWPCTKCGGMVTGALSHWTPLNQKSS